MYNKKIKRDWVQISKVINNTIPRIKPHEPKNCIAKYEEDCIYYCCIYSRNNGGRCCLEDQLKSRFDNEGGTK